MGAPARAFVGILASALAVGGVGGVPTAGAASGPKHGGSITLAIEGETTGGFCLPAAQLAAPGIEEVNAIYDTLVTINTKGQLVPYLAQSVTPNADFTQWTIRLRPGVKFQNGEALDANALKLNLDNKADRAKVVGLIKIWIGAGSLVVVEEPNEKRELKKFVRVADED